MKPFGDYTYGELPSSLSSLLASHVGIPPNLPYHPSISYIREYPMLAIKRL
ncbi:hypothetical protein [Paenibacillus arenosi]|uniref:Uncharacterized protein n=1 Tax=Paenibacillus arenosi TaxID=2774142 RepID=A0ABR9AS65_9BACL|nr:hypothetical protein [Paenibacillus arenosi]MBD8496959.1 hypothetical protein [Paenibacillus arenosi]